MNMCPNNNNQMWVFKISQLAKVGYSRTPQCGKWTIDSLWMVTSGISHMSKLQQMEVIWIKKLQKINK